ncbi:MAG: hypothetical protein P8183_23220 [Anaerolineae bacterium]
MNTILDTSTKTGLVNHALAVGQENHGHYKVMPKLGVIDEPMIINGWRFVPRGMDDAEVPKEGDRQVLALKTKGIVILQEIVGHNLVEEEEKRQKIEQVKNNLKIAGERLRGIASVAGSLLVWAVQAFAALALGIITFALAADPALIVVLEDGTWLCVVEWDS